MDGALAKLRRLARPPLPPLPGELDVRDLLGRLGVEVAAEERKPGRTELVARCPDPAHDDRHPSWSIAEAPGAEKHGRHHCRSCGFSGDAAGLAAAVLGVHYGDARRLLWDWYGSTDPDVLAGAAARRRGLLPAVGPREGTLPPGALPLTPAFPEYWSYATKRGLQPEEAAEHDVRAVLSGPLAGRLLFPIYMGGVLVSWYARRIDGSKDPGDSQLYAPGEGTLRFCLYGWDDRWHAPGGTAVLVEDVFSCLRVRRYLRAVPAAALRPGNCFAVLGSALGSYKAQLLRRYDRVLAMGDPDRGGEAMYEEARERLGAAREVLRARPRVDPDELPDAELAALLRAAAPARPRPEVRVFARRS